MIEEALFEYVPQKPTSVFIYVLCDPRDGQVRYVGQTRDLPGRFFIHCRCRYSSIGDGNRRERWTGELQDAGMGPRMFVVEETSFEEADMQEEQWMTYFEEKGATLYNKIRRKNLGLTFLLAQEPHDILERLAAESGVTMTSILEVLLRNADKAKEKTK